MDIEMRHETTPVVLVSGLGRCGTSAVMGMIAARGLRVVGIRPVAAAHRGWAEPAL